MQCFPITQILVAETYLVEEQEVVLLQEQEVVGCLEVRIILLSSR